MYEEEGRERGTTVHLAPSAICEKQWLCRGLGAAFQQKSMIHSISAEKNHRFLSVYYHMESVTLVFRMAMIPNSDSVLKALQIIWA